MAMSTPRTWVAGELVTAALMNTHIRDQLNALITSNSPTYASGLYSGGAATWTVVSGSQRTFKYVDALELMRVRFSIGPTSISGTTNELSITIPGSRIATNEEIIPCRIIDNSIGETGYCFVQPSGTAIKIRRANDGNFTTPQTNTLSVAGQIEFEI